MVQLFFFQSLFAAVLLTSVLIYLVMCNKFFVCFFHMAWTIDSEDMNQNT